MDYFARDISGSGTYVYAKNLPKTLREYLDYTFSSGSYAGDDFKSFDRKYRNAIKKLLPEGYSLYKYNSHHYCSSMVIQNPQGKFIYLSYSDVRFFENEWAFDILIRTMKHEKDWTGGQNHHTSLYSLNQDIQKLY